MWMLQVLLYGLLKGTREIVKKKSLGRSSVMEVLFFYTLFGFLFVCPDAGNAGGVLKEQMVLVIVKSFVIFLAWMCSFKAIKKMPISLYGILDLSRVLFAMLLATVVMHETLTGYQVTGLAFVCTGLLMLKGLPGKKKEEGSGEKVAPVIVMLAFASCLLNAFSGLLDKILMQDMSSSQLQFWYMLYLVLFYLVYIIVTKAKIRIKDALKNPWIWILAILFIIADRSLFLANANPDSRISVMTLIKQSGCLVTILGGKFIFHEKNIGYKLICATVIVAGIVIAVL
nr:EamA family transporter [Lachnospiraceae bacterium]